MLNKTNKILHDVVANHVFLLISISFAKHRSISDIRMNIPDNFRFIFGQIFITVGLTH